MNNTNNIINNQETLVNSKQDVEISLDYKINIIESALGNDFPNVGELLKEFEQNDLVTKEEITEYYNLISKIPPFKWNNLSTDNWINIAKYQVDGAGWYVNDIGLSRYLRIIADEEYYIYDSGYDFFYDYEIECADESAKRVLQLIGDLLTEYEYENMVERYVDLATEDGETFIMDDGCRVCHIYG